MNKRLLKLLKGASVVSFDIFDTLLVRPYIKPADMFHHIEKHTNTNFFAYTRILAEQQARREQGCPDVTLSQIYKFMGKQFSPLMKTELDWEYMTLRPNPQMKQVYDTCVKLGKRIIIASDMYLPKSFLEKVLKKNGFTNYEKIYVSGDDRIAKFNGTMFDKIITDTNVPTNLILHIGDNKKSDCIIPRKHGIKTWQYDTIIKQYTKSDKRSKEFYSYAITNVNAGILFATQAYIWACCLSHKSYWYNLGFLYLGPAAYSFVQWVNRTAKDLDIDALLYIARDGYTMKQVHEILNTHLQAFYIYAPRYINLIYRLDYRTDSSEYSITQQNTIIDHYRKENKNFNNMYKQTDFTKFSKADFITKNIEIIRPLANKKFNTYKKYLKSITKGKHNNIGVIDSIAANFSAQNLVSSALSQNNIFGLYWTTINDKLVFPHNTFLSFNESVNEPLKIKHWPLMEFLFSSPEFAVSGINNDGTPLYKKPKNDAEIFQSNTYPQISNGATDFTKFITDWFNGADIYIDYNTIVKYINLYIEFPTKTDKYYMKKIRTSTKATNDLNLSLFGIDVSTKDWLLHFFRSSKQARHAIWKTPFQHIITNIMSPLHIKIHELQDINIVLLPHLNNKYIDFNICIPRILKTHIVLGKNNK